MLSPYAWNSVRPPRCKMQHDWAVSMDPMENCEENVSRQNTHKGSSPTAAHYELTTKYGSGSGVAKHPNPEMVVKSLGYTVQTTSLAHRIFIICA
jgi:hypothetical protein